MILVTTALEDTFPENNKEKILFLGEWCKLYSRRSFWSKFDSETLDYHWDDRGKLHADYVYLQELYEELIEELVTKLNEIHAVNHSARYWRILIGPWLGYFIHALFDRWFLLEQAIETKNITKCRVIKQNPMDVIPNDMEHFISIFIGDDWNEAIFAQLLEMYWSKSILIKKVQLKRINKVSVKSPWQSLRLKMKCIFKRWINCFNALLPGKGKYFFISTYLPLKVDVSLQMHFDQLPRLWQDFPVPVKNSNQKSRKWKLDGLEASSNRFSEVARKMIPMHIPTAYLEGYDALSKKAELLPRPHHPKVIFTSNAYSADDLFKAWAAKKTELKVPLVIGQHGGHFGMSPFSFHEEHQIKIATKWLSWGWSDPSRANILPIGMFKNFNTTVKYNPKGGALMVEAAIPRYSYHLYAVPVSRQWLDYFDDQQKFLKFLPNSLRSQILLRLYNRDYGWNQALRWRDDMPEVRIDPGHQNIVKLIRKSRLYISTYNATTYLEALNWNIPTIIFWNPEHWELKEEVKPYFDMLESVGIFHKTPQSAAKKMTEVWDKIENWWYSTEVQEARGKFIDQYAATSDDKLDLLKSALMESGKLSSGKIKI